MELKLSTIPATVANFIGLRPVVGNFLQTNYPSARICLVDEMRTKFIGRPYPKIRRFSSLIIRYGVETSFFTNFKDGFNPNTFTLKVFSEESPRTDHTSDFTITSVVVGIQAYITITLNNDSLRYRTFNLVFVQTDSNLVKYISRRLVVMPEDYENSVRVEFSSNRGVFHYFPYADREHGQTQKFEFMGSMSSFDYSEDREVYKEVTTGRSRTVNNTLKRTYLLETYYQDFFAHEALAFIFFHESLNLNGKDYVVLEGYEANSEKLMDLTSGQIKLEDTGFGLKTNRCGYNGIGPPPETGFDYLFDFQLG